jgi:hypothetical protein
MASSAGLRALIEVGMAQAESICRDLTPSAYEETHQAISSFVQGKLAFESARQVLLATLKQDNLILSLQEVLETPDEPLPFREDAVCDGPAVLLHRKTHPWTAAEDQRLLGGIVRFGLDNWQAVAGFVGNGRNRAQCSQRWSRGLNPRISRKGWTAEEDQLLHELVRQYGEKSWAKIASILGNRSDVQCRYHYRQTARSGEEPDRRMALGNAAKLAASTVNVFIPSDRGNDRDSDNEAETISLRHSRQCISMPIFFSPPEHSDQLGRKLILPRLPLADAAHSTFRHLIEASATRPPMKIVGADPDSMNFFLRYFSR